MSRKNFILQSITTVYVDDIMMDLIPSFIKTRNEDLNKIQLALKNQDYFKVKNIGHNWKGVGSTLGFHYLTMAGEQLEILALNKDETRIAQLLKGIPVYLKNLNVQAKPRMNFLIANNSLNKESI